MKDYSGPCYTLKEAQDILELRQSELAHAIKEGKLNAVAYTERRSMLLFTPKTREQWIGRATCLYNGHMSLHINFITQLLDNKPIYLSAAWGSLLDASGFESWKKSYPFRRELPYGIIADWKEPEDDSAPHTRFAATPLPKEFTPALDSVVDIFSSMAKARRKTVDNLEEFDASIHKKGLQLDFKTNSKFEPSCLRIPKSEISRFKVNLELHKTELTKQKIIKKTNIESVGKRENQLHSLIGRIVIAEPKIGAKAAWALIRKEADSDVKLFDVDEILITVDDRAIEWSSRYGGNQPLKYDSFAPVLTRVRKKCNL